MPFTVQLNFLYPNLFFLMGGGDFSTKDEIKKQELLKELKDRTDALLKKQKSATTKSEKMTVAIGIGKIVEKILPAHKNFDLVPADCRFLAEPIDMIVFDGVSQNKVDKIAFMGVKTGSSTLNKHQKQICDAIKEYVFKLYPSRGYDFMKVKK